jgi:hypothetical protein
VFNSNYGIKSRKFVNMEVDHKVKKKTANVLVNCKTLKLLNFVRERKMF